MILINPDQLNALIKKNDVSVIDVRDESEYKKGHIEGAVNLPDIFYYLTDSTDSARKEMVDHFENALGNKGITMDRPVVVYENEMAARYGGSCRGYFILTYLGHPRAMILHGGIHAWTEAGLSLSTTDEQATPTAFKAEVIPEILATKNDVLEALNEDSSTILLDDRDRDEWEGRSSSPYGVDYSPRKGRIPGAVWIEWYDFMDMGTTPYFRKPEEILEICKRANIRKDDSIIIYCFKGSRASNTYVAMKTAGYNTMKVYLGSWYEWAKDFSLPVDDSKMNLKI